MVIDPYQYFTIAATSRIFEMLKFTYLQMLRNHINCVPYGSSI